MREDTSLVEYLYVDVDRLDAYFHQISLPVAYDKVPVWKAAIGISGPKAEAAQSRPGRPFTNHEKITRLHKYIEEHELLIKGRQEDPFEWDDFAEGHASKYFIVERMTARRGMLNPQNDAQGVNLWASTSPEIPTVGTGALFLIEDYRGDDDTPSFLTPYSSLLMLLREVKETLVDGAFDVFETMDKIEGNFGIDPIGALASLGVRFGPVRKIQATYRVRASFNGEENAYSTTTVGYPIVINAL